MKPIEGNIYLIQGFKDKATEKELSSFDVKFPQKAKFDGECFILKDNTGTYEYSVKHFDLNKLELVNPLTVQFIPRTRKGVKYFQIKMSKNGKVFNHQYNSKQGAKKSFESLVNDIKNDNFIVK